MKNVLLLICMLCLIAATPVTTRVGRYIVYDENLGPVEGFISEHNEFHTAQTAAAAASEARNGAVIRIQSPDFRVEVHLNLTGPILLESVMSLTDDTSNKDYTVWPVEVRDQDGLVVQNVSSHPDSNIVESGELPGDQHDALRIAYSRGVSIKYVSVRGAVDENMSVGGSRGQRGGNSPNYATIYRSLISDPLRRPELHPKNELHDCGLLIVGDDSPGEWGDYGPVVVRETLIANCGKRCPEMHAGNAITGVTRGELHAVIVNTIVWNPHREAVKFGSTLPANHVGILKVDYVGNLIVAGPDTDLERVRKTLQAGDWEDVYAADNWIEIDGERFDLIEWAGVTPGRDTPNFGETQYIRDPDVLFEVVTSTAGTVVRDEHDRGVVKAANDWRNREIIPSTGILDLAPYAGWTIVRDKVFNDNSSWGYRTDQSETLFLNCIFQDNGSGLLVQHGDGLGREDYLTDIAIINCQFTNNWKGSNVEHSHGLYVAQVNRLLIQNCYFDSNGWDGKNNETRSGFNHHAYIARCSNVIVKDCIFRRDSYLALKFRTEQPIENLTVENNVFLECAFPLDFGSNDNPGDIYFTNILVNNNVFARTLGWPLKEGVIPVGRDIKVSNAELVVISNNIHVDSLLDRAEATNIDSSRPFKNILISNNEADLPSLSGRQLWTNFPAQKWVSTVEITLLNNERFDNPKRLEDFDGDETSAQELLDYYR